MGDISTPSLTCRECGVEIFKKNHSKPPTWCVPCRRQRQQESIRACKARRRAGIKPPTHYTCRDCGGQFPRPTAGTLPLRCPDCWTSMERRRGANRRAERFTALRIKFETEGRWTTCETCGVRVRCLHQKGPAPRWCEPCRVDHLNAKRRQSRPWIRGGSCLDCGKSTDRASRPVPRLRCLSCARKLQDPATGQFIPNQHQPTDVRFPYSWTKRRGPYFDQYTRIEVFERDRWKCAVCRAKIDPGLRHPNTMSATIDHILPITQGGLDARANVRAAHLSCNIRRNNRGGGEQLALIG